MESRQLPSFRLGQRSCLDGLRGLSVLAVLLAHLHVIPGGFVGVEVLFVLSGFLITVLMIEEHEKRGAISLGNFYRKRFLRVLPPLGALLVVASIVSIAIGLRPPWDMLKEAAIAATFLANGQTIHGVAMPVLGHTWTLALEVQFYLIWPVAFVAMLRKGMSQRRILQVLAIGIVASAAWRIVLFTQRPPSGILRQVYLMRLFMGLDTHADTLLVGCLAGAVVGWQLLPDTAAFRARLHRTGWLALAGLTYIVLRCHHEQYAFYCGLFTLTGAMAASVIVWLVVAPPRVLLLAFAWWPWVALGRVSYSLYLFHMPIVVWFHPHSVGGVAGAFALAIAAAVVSFNTIERPVIRAKSRASEPIVAQPRRAA